MSGADKGMRQDMVTDREKADYVIRLGDNSLILGHRLSEWCGHAPLLEEEMALMNIALDLIGQSRLLLGYAGKLEGEGRGEDRLAYFRDAQEWRNLLMLELPNGDFARTMARQFLFDHFHFHQFSALAGSKDADLAAIAAKCLPEIRYHCRHSADWVLRLGDGTEESHQRLQTAFDELWGYMPEFFAMDDLDTRMSDAGIGADLAALKPAWDDQIDAILRQATIARPEQSWTVNGSREGKHSEHLGYLLAEMQFLQRAYPGATW